MRRFEWLFLDRKMPLKRPAGDVERREAFLGDRNEAACWRRDARDSDSADPDVSLERADVLEAASGGVSGGCWDGRRRWPWESEDRVEGEVDDFVRRTDDLAELARLIWEEQVCAEGWRGRWLAVEKKREKLECWVR